MLMNRKAEEALSFETKPNQSCWFPSRFVLQPQGFLACSFAPSQYYLLTMADEEPVDQKRYLEEACKPKCVKPLLEYQACVKRIQGDDNKHCTGQYFDYWSCVDKCVAPKLFTKIK